MSTKREVYRGKVICITKYGQNDFQFIVEEEDGTEIINDDENYSGYGEAVETAKQNIDDLIAIADFSR